MGLLSLNLGIVNLLPIPAVDGGRLVLIFVEKIIGRHRVAKVEYGLNYAGFIFLITLAILITGHDIWRIFNQ
jgi:regulator of sigma E protease